MTGPQGMGPLMSYGVTTLGDVFTPELTEDFTSGLGTWDFNLVATNWLITDLGDVPWSVSGGEALLSGLNPGALADSVGPSSPKMWASLENREDLTTGGNRTAKMFINFSRFTNSSVSSSAYFGAFGRDAGGSFVSVGKIMNGTTTTWMKQYNPLPIGTIVRVRHDGIGTITVDIDGVDAILFRDPAFLRARGWGIGGQSASGYDVAVDNLTSGTWGDIGIPVPWWIGDTADTDQITAGLWVRNAASGGVWPKHRTIGTDGGSYYSSSATFTGRWIELSNTSLLLGDCFCEATMSPDTSVLDMRMTLRGNSLLTQGYQFYWRSDSGGQWVIQRWDGTIIGTAAASNPGRYTMRGQCQGTSIKLFQLVSGNWVLRVSVTDSTYSAGNISFYFNDVSNQGTPEVSDICFGNIPTSLGCRVERQTVDTTTAAHIEFEILFDEPTSDFTAGDIVLSGAGTTGAGVTITGSGRKYTATVTGMEATGIVQLDVPAACCTALTHGASNTASTSIDNTVTSGLLTLSGMRGIWDASEFTSGTSAVKNWAGGAFDPVVGQMDNAFGSNLVTISGRQWYSFTYTNSNSRLVTNGTSPMNGVTAPQWLMIVVDTDGNVVFYDCADSGSARAHCYNLGGANITMYGSSAVVVGTDDDNAHVYFFLWNGASSKFFKDGVLIGTFNPGTPSVAGTIRMAIGNVAGGGVPGSAGTKFGMWMVGDGVPSDANIIACMNNWKAIFSI
jgi:hypothetical protein